VSELGALSIAWVAIEAALPVGWQVDGLMTTWAWAAFRESVPELPASGSPWVAAASHQTRADAGLMSAIGEGDTPEQALNRLADKLREFQGSSTG